MSERPHWWSGSVRGVLLFVRTRRLVAVLVATVSLSLLLGWVRDLTVAVPFAPDTTTVDLYLLTPVFVAALAGATLGAPLAAWEQLAQHRMVWLRGLHLAVLLVAVVVMALPVGGKPLGELPAVVRNGMVLVAVVLVWGVLIEATIAWLTAVLFAALCFFVGKGGADGGARGWALLVRGFDAPTAASATVLFMVAAAIYIRWGPQRDT